MDSLEAELERARALDVESLADAIESIGFECTRCGGCCTGEADEPHTATVFPDEVREVQDAAASDDADSDYDWRDVARPMPYGLSEGADGLEGETFEWALQTDACGDCTFYEEEENPDQPGDGYCSVHESRPLICQTYPFSVALAGTSQPMGEAVDESGIVRAHECEGLGRDIDREDAEALAATLRERAIRELEEAIAVRDEYEPVATEAGEVVIHDSEGAKTLDGSTLE
ncbi:YkgJ family cysteine cluster protein [Salinarchaeum laminariae]|uniref:YkgJ family cysteine cluster protein n=1 Tax=Salinarchaeum laminariae TaxID=869888 RepID=UPI0020C10637|nr:YkgJ family cysteine cluster protein [Salinarchaeum laminariae]